MKNSSKEEMLEQEILKMAEKCGDKKWLRVKRTFFIMCVPIYLIELCFVLKSGLSGIDIDDICGLLFAPPVAVGSILFICYGILFYIIDGAMKDENAIAKKIGELNAIKFNKFNDCKEDKTNEIESHLEELRILLAPIVKVEGKLNLEDLKELLEPIVDEYHFIKVKERLDGYSNNK